MHRRATRTAWWADRPGRNPNEDPEKSGSKMGVSTCAIACRISLSRQVGTPSNRSPPPGLGITTRRTGDGRYVPASRAWRTCAQCSRSHGTSSSVVMPSTPGAPALALTRLNARPRFSGESNCSHNETSRPGMTASSGRAGRPLRSAAVLNGPHRLLPAAGPRPRDGCDHRDQHEQHRFLRLTRRSALPGHHPIPAGTTTSADFCPVSPHLTMRAARRGDNDSTTSTRADLPG